MPRLNQFEIKHPLIKFFTQGLFKANEKAMILLKGSLPLLIQRFRLIILEEIRKGKDASFDELILRLKNEGEKLL